LTTTEELYDQALQAALRYLVAVFDDRTPARQPESQKINQAVVLVNKWRESSHDEDIEVAV
jgi:hypothetical protein